MPLAKNVENICYHCSAGFSLIPDIRNWWKTLGWKNLYGYHIIIYMDGTRWYLDKDGNYTTDETKLDLTKITNGVGGFNSNTIHICTIGGIEKIGKEFKPKDTRTPEQIESLHYSTQLVIKWLSDNGKDVTKKLGVVGHYDYSLDKNNTGVIESYERNKACPSWDVIRSDFHYLYSSADRYTKLPTVK